MNDSPCLLLRLSASVMAVPSVGLRLIFLLNLILPQNLHETRGEDHSDGGEG
jgi:hypothetical protein